MYYILHRKGIFIFFRYEKAIRTVEDLADSNMHWGATHEAWVFSIKSAKQVIKIFLFQQLTYMYLYLYIRY